jgi:sugar phosphate isomerase/epimerase
MYKNLNAVALGVSGRQSEIIELTLTYGFRGMDVDMQDLVKRSKLKGAEAACRFISSANLRIGGFELPISLSGADDTFDASLSKLDLMGEIADVINASRCLVTLDPASDELPYHENYERHRVRLGKIAEKLATREIRLGVGLDAAAARRKDRKHQFIQKFEELLSLIRGVGASNVGLLLDTWHWQVGGGTLEQLRDWDPEKILAVRLADIPADADVSAANKNDRILPTENGLVDTTAIGQLLVDKGYDGPVTPWPSTVHLRGKTRESIVQAARDSLEDLWTAVGLSSPKMAMAATASSGDSEEDLELEDTTE